MKTYAIGLDYGTLSARAVLVSTADGKVIAESEYAYPHGVMDKCLPDGTPLPAGFALQHPQDYLDALKNTVRDVMRVSGLAGEQVIGIGVDFTSATILPVDENNVPLCMKKEFMQEPHAYVKLWKHHGAEKEAAFIDEMAHETSQEWLHSHGGKVSAEWTVPKIMETHRQAPEVYEKARYFLEAMDWIVSVMTHETTASLCGAGYKMFYHDGHLPDESFFELLDPALKHFTTEKYPQKILPIGSCAGTLCEEAAETLGLCPGTPVGTPIIDAHSSVLGSGVHQTGELMIIMGTSACHMLLTDTNAGIRGIQGIVRDGILPGYYGIEAGQPCVGDLFAWVSEVCMPREYALEAEEKGQSAHQFLSGKLGGYQAGRSGLIALDWFNGVRTPLMDFDLSGMIVGLDLQTKPEEIYLAMIEATAYGTRRIMDELAEKNIPVTRVLLSGGIPAKNPLICQVYADVLKRPVTAVEGTRTCALGAAFLGMAAASETLSINEIVAKLGSKEGKEYKPCPRQSEVYDQLYDIYRNLADHFAGNTIMKQLKALQRK